MHRDEQIQPGPSGPQQLHARGHLAGTITKWSEISDNGDALSGAGCTATSTITRVVRKDSSGTAHFLKKYLGLINKAPFETEEARPRPGMKSRKAPKTRPGQKPSER